MYLQAIKGLDEPTLTHRLITASVIPLYVVIAWGVFYCICLCFLVLNQANEMAIKEEKIFILHVLLKLLHALINDCG